MEMAFQNFILLAPLAVLLFFYYFVLVKRHLGEAMVAAMGMIALMSGA